MRIGFFPNMGKSNIMAVLKMAAHICKDEGIEVFLNKSILPLVLVVMVPSSIWQDKFTHIMYLFVVLTLVNSAF